MHRIFILFLLFCTGKATAQDTTKTQPITLKEAVDIAVKNYGIIKAKANYAEAAKSRVQQAQAEYYPNVNVGAQQSYGTINGLNGPTFAFTGVNTISSGLPTASQTWTSAFGALYLTSVNWDFFAFGRAIERVKAAQAVASRETSDYDQEIFQHKIRVASAYLNLVAAEQLLRSYRKNLERTDTLKYVVVAKAKNGLIPGVDSSQASAERSAARILLTNAIDAVQQRSNDLAQLMGVEAVYFQADTAFVSKIPQILQSDSSLDNHPVLKWYRSRIAVSNKQADYLHTFLYPTVSAVGILQTRASSFGNNYLADPDDFHKGYFSGISPTRTNYLVGLGITWNFTSLYRVNKQVKAERQTAKGLTDEYDLAAQRIKAQLVLSDVRIKNALSNRAEAPIQVKAASDAYLQRSVLYRNGLTDIVNVTQAAYQFIRAETDRDVANNNVWQALLLRAAALGDFNVFAGQL